jgi:hypothetical protein
MERKFGLLCFLFEETLLKNDYKKFQNEIISFLKDTDITLLEKYERLTELRILFDKF